MIREDRELLAELARLNSDIASLAVRMLDGSAGVAEQQRYAQRLIAAGECLHRRARGTSGAVIESDIVAPEPPALHGAPYPKGDTSPEPSGHRDPEPFSRSLEARTGYGRLRACDG